MVDVVSALVSVVGVATMLAIERIAAGARAAQYRVERDAAQAQADRLRCELVHLARDLATIRASACRCHADDVVALVDACDRRIDVAMTTR